MTLQPIRLTQANRQASRNTAPTNLYCPLIGMACPPRQKDLSPIEGALDNAWCKSGSWVSTRTEERIESAQVDPLPLALENRVDCTLVDHTALTLIP